MRSAAILLGLCMAFSSLMAQFPFKGGAGDGYAMVELNNSTHNSLPEIAELAVYPNPLQQKPSSQVFIQGDFVHATVSLADTKGRVLLERKKFTAGNSLEITEFPAGIYFLKVQAAGKQSARKLVISP